MAASTQQAEISLTPIEISYGITYGIYAINLCNAIKNSLLKFMSRDYDGFVTMRINLVFNNKYGLLSPICKKEELFIGLQSEYNICSQKLLQAQYGIQYVFEYKDGNFMNKNIDNIKIKNTEKNYVNSKLFWKFDETPFIMVRNILKKFGLYFYDQNNPIIFKKLPELYITNKKINSSDAERSSTFSKSNIPEIFAELDILSTRVKDFITGLYNKTINSQNYNCIFWESTIICNYERATSQIPSISLPSRNNSRPPKTPRSSDSLSGSKRRAVLASDDAPTVITRPIQLSLTPQAEAAISASQTSTGITRPIAIPPSPTSTGITRPIAIPPSPTSTGITRPIIIPASPTVEGIARPTTIPSSPNTGSLRSSRYRERLIVKIPEHIMTPNTNELLKKIIKNNMIKYIEKNFEEIMKKSSE